MIFMIKMMSHCLLFRQIMYWPFLQAHWAFSTILKFLCSFHLIDLLNDELTNLFHESNSWVWDLMLGCIYDYLQLKHQQTPDSFYTRNISCKCEFDDISSLLLKHVFGKSHILLERTNKVFHVRLILPF